MTLFSMTNMSDNRYQVILNFGIFDGPNDTSTKYIFGANSPDDIIEVDILAATGAMRKIG